MSCSDLIPPQFRPHEGEAFSQYVLRVFPDLADALYVRGTTARDHEMFRLGVLYAFVEETWSLANAMPRRSPQEIVDEFLKGLREENEDGLA
jgi:hypothetical protein